MYFEEKDIELCIDGMGIVFFSPKTTKDIPEGIDFFNQEYSAPADVSAHLKKGDVVGFCTGSGGDFILKFWEGYPDDRINNEYSVSARLGIRFEFYEYFMFLSVHISEKIFGYLKAKVQYMMCWTFYHTYIVDKINSWQTQLYEILFL